jgi:large subunit ribosomal protein L29
VKAAELREKSNEELEQLIADSNDELMHYRLQMATGQVENICKNRTMRREIARIKTILNERKRAEDTADAGDGN